MAYQTLLIILALCAFVSSCLIGLDKCPGTQPVGIGGILLPVWYSGLRAGMGSLWEEFGEEEGWGILLVDARNAFNELNHKAMLWH
eukprot:769204-Ditylum_brightwellii.AAC.1